MKKTVILVALISASLMMSGCYKTTVEPPAASTTASTTTETTTVSEKATVTSPKALPQKKLSTLSIIYKNNGRTFKNYRALERCVSI